MLSHKKTQKKISEHPRLKDVFAAYIGVSIPTRTVERSNKWSTRVYQETEPTGEGIAILQEITEAAKTGGINNLTLATPGTLHPCDKRPGRVTLHIKEENSQWVLQDECTFG